MMIKLFYITCILLAINNQLLAQVKASATISATISSPVGAEKISDINFGEFSAGASKGTIILGADGIQRSKGGVKIFTDRPGAIASLNIIGSSSVYYISMQSEPVILNAGTKEIHANLFTLSSKHIQADNLNLIIGASITVDAFQSKGNYSSPFAVTINFN